MIYLFSQYWGWILASVFLGVIVGWLTHSNEDKIWFRGWVVWASALFIISFIVAYFKIFSGKYGLYLDTALIMFVSYIVGCILGSVLKNWTGRTPNFYEVHSSPGKDLGTILSSSESNVVTQGSHSSAFKAVNATSPVSADISDLKPIDKDHPGSKPVPMLEPAHGKADDLKRIKGIGKQNEQRLNALGIWHFSQIADWKSEQVAWVGSYLAFVGRIERENWVDQAKILAAGKETEFSKRVDAGDVPSSSG